MDEDKRQSRKESCWRGGRHFVPRSWLDCSLQNGRDQKDKEGRREEAGKREKGEERKVGEIPLPTGSRLKEPAW